MYNIPIYVLRYLKKIHISRDCLVLISLPYIYLKVKHARKFISHVLSITHRYR